MCDFLNPHQKEKTFQVLTPKLTTAGPFLKLYWNFSTMIFILGKKSRLVFQIIEFQTATNIAPFI